MGGSKAPAVRSAVLLCDAYESCIPVPDSGMGKVLLGVLSTVL